MFDDESSGDCESVCSDDGECRAALPCAALGALCPSCALRSAQSHTRARRAERRAARTPGRRRRPAAGAITLF